MAKQKWPVGLAEIAAMFGVDEATPTRWRYRSHKGRMHPPLPDPDGYISGSPFWWDLTMEHWATDSRRRLVRWPVAGQMVPIPANGRDTGTGRVIPVPEFRGPGDPVDAGELVAADG